MLNNDDAILESTIPASGPWPEVHLTHRLASAERVDKYLDATDQNGAAVALIVEHVKTWDVSDDDEGRPAPVTETTVRRLPHPVFSKMLSLVSGYSLVGVEQLKFVANLRRTFNEGVARLGKKIDETRGQS